MKYIGVEIFEGIISQEFYLEENQPLEKQWKFLHDDIGGVLYLFNGYEFYVDISWHGDWGEVQNSAFGIRIFEGLKTSGKNFYWKQTKADFKELKNEFQNAIYMIEKLKLLSDIEIINFKEVEHSYKFDK